jgi:hypothetical protein
VRSDEFMSGTYDEWCRWVFDGLRDGGTWSVPRSLLVFRKDEAAREFVLIDTGDPQNAEVDQDEDYEAIREHFEHAGIAVRKGEK